VAVGALHAGGGVGVVLGTEGIAAFGTVMQQTLVFVAQRPGRRIVLIHITAHVVLMAAQTGLGADRADGEGRTQTAILIPAQPLLVADDDALVHVVVAGMADQTVDPFLGLARHIADRHHFLSRRLIVAADVTLAAALATQHHLALLDMLRDGSRSGPPSLSS
jgi:hypothetical protein